MSDGIDTGGKTPTDRKTVDRRTRGPAASSSRRRGNDPVLPQHSRYDAPELLARGGQGDVFRVHDRQLDRAVALKTIRSEDLDRHRTDDFLREATKTAQLEHPNIVPIHDVGLLDDSRPYYTMRLFTGRSLGAVLRGLRGASNDGEWSLVRLVQVLQQACLALQFAHERHVVHQDVKPANIMLGAFGEVILVDWGISRQTTPGIGHSSTGALMGTVSYMSPEHARAGAVDARCDVYSLGVTLYEVLTLQVPFEAKSDAEIVAQILRDPPPTPSSRTSRFVPVELEDLVLKTLAKSPDDRPQSAREVHDALLGFLEGVRDRQQRMTAAEARREKGDAALEKHDALRQELAGLEQEVAHLETAHPPWDPIPTKRLLLDARRRVVGLKDDVLESFLEAVNAYTDALAHAPDHAQVRRTLAREFLRRHEEAELARDRSLAQVFRALVERFHDGTYARQLDGRGSLRLRVTPAEAEIVLHRLVERDLVLVDGPGRRIGRGEACLDELEMGSYVVVATAPGHEPARLPIAIARNTEWDGDLQLLPKGTLPAGFVHVPAMDAWLGGDPIATNSWPLRRERIGSLFVQRHPVTYGEWCRFLDASGIAAGDELVPFTEDDGPLCARDVSGRWRPALRETARLCASWGEGTLDRLPVVGVHETGIEAFTEWRSKELDLHLRLPSSDEWEAVARGADRRLHPWGDVFDATLAHVRVSLKGRIEPSPVGSFPTDRSVHGVHDLAGNVHEWTSSWFDESVRLREVRGGCWALGPVYARSAWRGGVEMGLRTAKLGFRNVAGPAS